MARKRCTNPLCLHMKLTHVKQINQIHKSPTVYNSSLALPKTCLIMIYDIKPRPATKANNLQNLKNKCLPTTTNTNSSEEIKRKSLASSNPLSNTFQDSANRLIGEMPCVRKPAFCLRRDARKVNN